MWICQNPVLMVKIEIARKWMFIYQKIIVFIGFIGIDPPP